MLPVPPTNTDSSVFIRILRGKYGYTETMPHYTEVCRSTYTYTAGVDPRDHVYSCVHEGQSIRTLTSATCIQYIVALFSWRAI